MADQLQLLLNRGWLSAEDVNPSKTKTTTGPKIVFLRLPKNASTSVIDFLSSQDQNYVVGGHNESMELCFPEKMLGFRDLCSPKREGPVDTSTLRSIAAATRLGIGSEAYDGAFVFAFVRNPYDRVVSSWKYTNGEKCTFPEVG